MTVADADRQGGRLERPPACVSCVLFLFSAAFFVISAPRPGDVPGLIGALLILLACAVLFMPYLPRVFGVAGSKNTRSS